MFCWNSLPTYSISVKFSKCYQLLEFFHYFLTLFLTFLHSVMLNFISKIMIHFEIIMTKFYEGNDMKSHISQEQLVVLLKFTGFNSIENYYTN